MWEHYTVFTAWSPQRGHRFGLRRWRSGEEALPASMHSVLQFSARKEKGLGQAEERYIQHNCTETASHPAQDKGKFVLPPGSGH